MLKRTYGWLLAAGMILILAGMAVLIRLDTADSAQDARPQMVEAIVDLQSCFCHNGAADAPLSPVEHAEYAEHADRMVADLSGHTENTPNTAVETRLISAGQRILALPATRDNARTEAVIRGFLQIFDQTRLTSAGSANVEALAALDQLEFWLNLLENQAQPNRWSRANSLPQPPAASAWQTVSLVSRDTSAAFEFIDPVPDVTRLSARLSDDRRAVLRAGEGFGIHRRGPPAGTPICVGFTRRLSFT